MPEKPQHVFLLLFTTSVCWTVPLVRVYLEFPVVPIIKAATLSFGLVFALILLTSWAGRRGYDLDFLGNLLFTCGVVIQIFLTIKVFSQDELVMPLIYGLIAVMSCCCVVKVNSYLMGPSSSKDNILITIVLVNTVHLFMSLLYLIINVI